MKKLPIFLIGLVVVDMYAMDAIKKVGSNALTTVYDKYDPESVIKELELKGVSKNIDEKMTQEHRVNRVIRYYVQADNPQGLCSVLSKILAGNYPRSPLASEMAHEYLSSKRSLLKSQSFLLSTVNQTLDKLNPGQIAKDLYEGQTFDTKKIDLESRANTSLEYLALKEKDKGLGELIRVLAGLTTTERKIVPGLRVCELANTCLEKRIKELSKVQLLLAQITPDKKAAQNKKD